MQLKLSSKDCRTQPGVALLPLLLLLLLLLLPLLLLLLVLVSVDELRTGCTTKHLSSRVAATQHWAIQAAMTTMMMMRTRVRQTPQNRTSGQEPLFQTSSSSSQR